MRFQEYVFPWLGPNATAPYASLELARGFRWLSLIQAPVPFLTLQPVGKDPSDIRERPEAYALRVGRPRRVDPNLEHRVYPCAYHTGDAAALLGLIGQSGYRGDLAAATAAQATALGGATTPTLTWNDRRCIVVASDEPLDDPGRVYLDVIVGAAGSASSNYLLQLTLRGLRSMQLCLENLGAYTQTGALYTQTRKIQAGEPANAIGTVAAAPNANARMGASMDNRNQMMTTVMGAYASPLDIGVLLCNSSLGTASYRCILQGEPL